MTKEPAPTAEEQPLELPHSDMMPLDRVQWIADYSPSHDAKALARQLLAALRSNREKDAQLDEKDAKIAELEKNIAKRKAAAETTTRLFMQLQARAEAAEAKLRAVSDALEKIADPQSPGITPMCECEHDTKDCCALAGYYCPQCIAGRALLSIRAIVEAIQ